MPGNLFFPTAVPSVHAGADDKKLGVRSETRHLGAELGGDSFLLS